jgi:hypothetical protein
MHGLQQYVTRPTRGTHTLDLVFCNDSNCVINTRSLEPFSTSDHCQVSFQVPYKTESNTKLFITRDFKLADWAGIRTFLDQIDFFQLFHGNLAVTSIIEEFYKILNLCLDRFVPIKYNTNRTNSQLVKYPYALRRLLRRKAAAWRKYSTPKTLESLAVYKNIASQCKSAIYSFSLSYENNLIANANIGSFYRYANSKFSCKSAVGPLCNSDGSLIIDAADKAAILLQTFIKNSVIDNGVLPVDSSIRRSHNKLNYIHFTPTLVRRAIKKLKHKTRGGPDGIPPSFLINCCEELCTLKSFQARCLKLQAAHLNHFDAKRAKRTFRCSA